MKWVDLIEDNTVVPDIWEYEEKLKQFSIENVKIFDCYYEKQEAFKMNMYKDFESCLSNGFVITKRDEKNISAKNLKIIITLWEEQKQDNRLVLNFRQHTGNSWAFALHIDPTEKIFEKLTDNLGWYVNQEGKLETFKDKVNTIEFYRNEVAKAEKLIEAKRKIYKDIDKLDFRISLWQGAKIIESFKTFEESLYKAVELS